MKALDFLHTECFKGDLKHFIGQEGILIDEENIVIIMEKYAEHNHSKMMKKHVDNLINCNTHFEDDQVIAIKWEMLNVPEMNKKLKKW